MTERQGSCCEVCSGAEWKRDDTASRILALPPRYSVRACATCGQRRLEPQLSDAELKALYAESYFNSQQVAPGTRAGLAASSDDYASVVAPGRRIKFAKTVHTLKDLHPRGRTLLDVGAATGEFVKVAREHGLDADGIERSEFAVRLARDLHSIELQCLNLAAVNKTGFYDFIHLNHVFEHFNEPLVELGYIHRLLVKGGLLYLEVPYQFHAIEKLLFRMRRTKAELTLHSLHHPFFYTPRTIARLLTANGFDVVQKSVFDSDRYEAATVTQKIKKALWRALAACGIGNYVEVYARRRAT